MLAVKNRLRNKKDIEHIFQHGQGLKEGLLFLKIAKNNLDTSRIGFVVSQKVSKKAIVRNKVKRRLRALTKKHLQEIKNGVDLLFVAFPGIEKKNYAHMEECIGKLLIKAANFKK